MFKITGGPEARSQIGGVRQASPSGVTPASRKLRSADKQLLSQPPCRLKSYGDCAFCCAAPVVWNNIPHSVKTAKTVDNFKVKLKTHFYSVSFA